MGSKRQHFKGKKRMRSWHRTAREGRQWQAAMRRIDKGLRKATKDT